MGIIGKLKIKDKVEDAAGAVCKIAFPIKIDIFEGRGTEISICTLSSNDLLARISATFELMNNVQIAGRLLSENKGIDDLIRYCIRHSSLKYLLLCGYDSKGHLPGDALVNLFNHGVDENGRIIHTAARRPFLTCSKNDIEKFRKQVTLIDIRNCCDIDKITQTVFLICSKSESRP